jgi:hypothetical protein
MASRGSVKLFTIGYTSSDISSLKKTYPIKRQYIQLENTSTPVFPESYSVYSTQKYWFPFSQITPADEDYIPYTDGDEYTFNDTDYKREPTSAANPSKNKTADLTVGTRVVFNNEVYESVGYTFKWSDTGFDYSKNPYLVENVSKWRKLSDTGTEWVQYWYHPQLKRFFPLEDTPALQNLPEVSTFEASKWDSFIGDAKGLNLSNFTDAQIKELASQGLSLLAAKTIVLDADRRVSKILAGTVSVDTTTGTPVVRNNDNGLATSGTTVVVSKSTGGAEGEGGTYSYSLDQPQIVQFYNLPDGTTSQTPARFVFDYRPNNVSYSNIGSEWTEIPRVNNTPFIDFKSFKLMKISFEFLVGDNDNIFSSCDDKLKELRAIAMRPEPVIFLGFDAMFTEHLSIGALGGGSGIVFAIVDMSITSVQRTRAGFDGSAGSFSQTPTGEINRATVSMTIQELPLETPLIAVLPKIGKTPAAPKAPGTTTDDLCRELFLNNPGITGNSALRAKLTKNLGGCAGVTGK